MIVTGSVALFAVFMLIPWDFGSYFVCMLLPIGYMMMCGGFCAECGERHRAAAYAGMGFAAVYTVLVLLVYFAQTTAVRLDSLDEQAMRMLDYGKGGLFFYYDLTRVWDDDSVYVFYRADGWCEGRGGPVAEAADAGAWRVFLLLLVDADDGDAVGGGKRGGRNHRAGGLVRLFYAHRRFVLCAF